MMKMLQKKFMMYLSVLAVFGLLLTACGPSVEEPAAQEPAAEEPAEEAVVAHKACFIYSSTISDMGWTFGNERGRLHVNEQVEGIETAYIEEISDFGGSDVEKVIEDFIQQDCTIIVGTSFGYTEAIATKAGEHPDVTFINESHYIPGDNIQSHWLRLYEGFFLTGVLAGSMTESDVIGIVATFPIPELLRRLNGFARGVQEVNPDATIKVVWINSWYDPPKETGAAESLIAAGADVVQHLSSSPASLQAAQAAGVYGIGYQNDQGEYGPDAYLASMLIEWGPLFADSIENIVDGTWESGTIWFGLESGALDAGPFSEHVPQDIQDLVADYKDQVISGDFVIWEGPMYSQDGTLQIPEGESRTDEEIDQIDWLIQGIEGKIPSMEAEVAEESTEGPAEVQYCTIYSTSITDNGWDRSGHESYQRFAANPGVDIEVLEHRFVEGLWGDEAEAAMREYAESGCDIIWSHGGYNDIIYSIHEEYPEVMFVEVGSGWIGGDANNYHYMYRCYDGMYALGVLAGLMTEGTVIGAAGGYPAEDVNDVINAYFAGAKSVKPELKQKVGFINSWYDPVAAGELAEAQKAAGADQLYMAAENFDVCGPGTGAMCYGPYIDFSELYPGAVMASYLATWEPAYEWALQEWLTAKATGEWNGGPVGFENNMASGACTLKLGEGIEETLPSDVLEQFNDTIDAIMSGALVPELNKEEPVSE
jgi:basic membrane lipoprotein Med (substrate-binding protein (PBP1-ABC) superfamily)